MPFDNSKYHYDINNEMYDAKIAEGAILYRLTTMTHSGINEVLNGRGSMYSRIKGRFHTIQQPATYCANNIIVCMAEVMFHMYRNVLRELEENQPYSHIRQHMHQKRYLVILEMKEIDDIVFIDAESIRVEYGSRIGGTMVVFPDIFYDPFYKFSERLREQRKRGIFYPSARHSKDLCIVLFEDETSRIRLGYQNGLNIELTLISEDLKLAVPQNQFNPFVEKIHPTLGHYQFVDVNAFDSVMRAGFINPYGIPATGLIDFVRRKYHNYPSDAIIN